MIATLPISSQKQRGAVLAIALIMLLLITLMAVTSFNMSRSNLQVTANLENRTQAIMMADAALEEAISTTLFFNNPNNVFINSCETNNTKCYDINADGNNDITVTVQPPQCIIVAPITNSDLNIEDPNDVGCLIETGANSLCADSIWDLQAVAVDNLTAAQATVRQGVGVRVSLNNVAAACP
ncbi:PilX N-terminal domain-containing pilus assembly protein [Nitrincola alkalilacustris]|uniref:PilX N-terminal domain-containing pilus assembly protein n=1 Tax=Nitrincola alkalilacustris TaxID=1571224 RepID=UPI00124C59D7|nr:PilX N-terminal domain-containing pilus assembly protein [Nitrincola alkalilacustris]